MANTPRTVGDYHNHPNHPNGNDPVFSPNPDITGIDAVSTSHTGWTGHLMDPQSPAAATGVKMRMLRVASGARILGMSDELYSR